MPLSSAQLLCHAQRHQSAAGILCRNVVDGGRVQHRGYVVADQRPFAVVGPLYLVWEGCLGQVRKWGGYTAEVRDELPVISRKAEEGLDVSLGTGLCKVPDCRSLCLLGHCPHCGGPRKEQLGFHTQLRFCRLDGEPFCMLGACLGQGRYGKCDQPRWSYRLPHHR